MNYLKSRAAIEALDEENFLLSHSDEDLCRVWENFKELHEDSAQFISK